MSDQKCVVEGCDLEYDVVCSFSFYNANISTDNEGKRQAWIDGAMQDESECLWRHVSLQLCGYHFELDNQGLWIDSPMLPELLTPQDRPAKRQPTAIDKKLAEIIKIEHNYNSTPVKEDLPEDISRLNVRQLVDTLGYLSLKNLQRKQLWVVKVETDKAEASITQSEQVITKMTEPKQVIEIIPSQGTSSQQPSNSETLTFMEENIPENFIYEIAEEQEISMDEVKEIPAHDNPEWVVNIIPDEAKPKYAYIKHCSTGKKKRHFTADMNEITLQGDFENYYILPDVDPSVGVEITTSYEPENYIVEEYEHLVLDDRPKKRAKPQEAEKKKRKKVTAIKEEPKELSIPEETSDWSINSSIVYEDEDFDDKKAAARVRRKNKKYLGYDFVT